MKTEYKHPDIQGWMGDGELIWLWETAQKMDSVVEIGSWKGRSTHALCSGCLGPVIAVDHWQGSPSERETTHAGANEAYIDFLENMKAFKNLSILRMESERAASFFCKRAVDMVFIDGAHEYEWVKKDIDLWFPKVRRMICGHDIGEKGVREAVENLQEKYLLAQSSKSGPGTIWSIEL